MFVCVLFFFGLWQTRQIVRWHCRLSHVAAHTRMLTGTSELFIFDEIYFFACCLLIISTGVVFVEDLLSQPVVEVEKIVSFIGYKVDRPAIVAES